MTGKNKVFLVTALILIPMLLVLVPLKLAHKAANGASMAAGKHLVKCNHCQFNSVTFQSEQSTGHAQRSCPGRPPISLIFIKGVTDIAPSVFPHPTPLRC